MLSHDQSADKLQKGVLLQVDCIKAYLVFRKTPKELETRLASSNSQRRRKKLIRPYSKIASGRSTGSSTFGTTTSLEMNKRSSQFYQWRLLRMRFVRVSNDLDDWDLIPNNLKRSCVSAAGRDRDARQPWNSEEGSALPGDKCFGFTKMFVDKILKAFSKSWNIGLWKRSPWRTGSQVEAGGWGRYENILFIFHIQYFTASVVALSPHAGVLPWGFCLQEGRRRQGDVHY